MHPLFLLFILFKRNFPCGFYTLWFMEKNKDGGNQNSSNTNVNKYNEQLFSQFNLLLHFTPNPRNLGQNCVEEQDTMEHSFVFVQLFLCVINIYYYTYLSQFLYLSYQSIFHFFLFLFIYPFIYFLFFHPSTRPLGDIMKSQMLLVL